MILIFLAGYGLGVVRFPTSPRTADILEYGAWYGEAGNSDESTTYIFRNGKLSTHYRNVDGKKVDKEVSYQYSDEGTLLLDKKAMMAFTKRLPEDAASMEWVILHINECKGIYSDDLSTMWKIYNNKGQLLDLIILDDWYQTDEE